MAKRDQNNFKGDNFEIYFRTLIKQASIHCRSIIYKKEYECDAIFVIDNELFIVECKAWKQPYTIREHVRLAHETLDEIDKFNKKVDFYTANIGLIINKLDLSKHWKPVNVHRVFLFSHMIGGYKFIEDCHLTDRFILTLFFRRKAIGLNYEGEHLIKYVCADLEGKITAKKLLNFIKNPPNIEIMSKQCKTIEHVSFLKEYTVNLPGYVKFTPDVVRAEPHDLEQVLRDYEEMLE